MRPSILVLNADWVDRCSRFRGQLWRGFNPPRLRRPEPPRQIPPLDHLIKRSHGEILVSYTVDLGSTNRLLSEACGWTRRSQISRQYTNSQREQPPNAMWAQPQSEPSKKTVSCMVRISPVPSTISLSILCSTRRRWPHVDRIAGENHSPRLLACSSRVARILAMG